MRQIDYIVIHCADTPNGRPNTIRDVDDWHRARQFNRRPSWVSKFNKDLKHVGYHFVIHVDGSVHTGRHVDEVGAHAQGYNSYSIGICMVGRDKYTPMQWNSLKGLIERLRGTYPEASIVGHYQLDKHGKTCPNFSVEDWLDNNLSPTEDQILF